MRWMSASSPPYRASACLVLFQLLHWVAQKEAVAVLFFGRHTVTFQGSQRTAERLASAVNSGATSRTIWQRYCLCRYHWLSAISYQMDRRRLTVAIPSLSLEFNLTSSASQLQQQQSSQLARKSDSPDTTASLLRFPSTTLVAFWAILQNRGPGVILHRENTSEIFRGDSVGFHVKYSRKFFRGILWNLQGKFHAFSPWNSMRYKTGTTIL